MATNYFEMMRDVVGSYGDGLDLARSRARFDAEEARKATQFSQEQEQYQRKLGMQRDTDAAFGTYQALQGGVYDGSKADFGASAPDADLGPAPQLAPVSAPGGLAVPKRAVTRGELFDARKNIAVASRDYAGLGKLEDEGRAIAWDETFAKHYKAYTASPEQIDAAASHINTNSKTITLHEPDKQGFRQMSIVAPDGKATLLKLGKHDQAQLWAASQMIDQDPTRALGIMAGIDKNLAAAVAAENGIVDKVGQHQNTMAYQKGQLAEAEQRTAIARAGLGAKTRELSPDTVRELNDLSVRISEEKDPRQRAVLEAQYNRRYGLAATEIGRVVPPRNEQARRPEFTPKDIADVVAELRMDPANKKMPYEQLRDKAVGILGGSNANAMPGWDDRPPATSDKPAAVGLDLSSLGVSELRRRASKPRGVSSEEANAAQEELASRQQPSLRPIR